MVKVSFERAAARVLLCSLALLIFSSSRAIWADTQVSLPASGVKTWSFDHERAFNSSKDWTAIAGDWEVLRDPSAPSQPNTLGVTQFGLPETEGTAHWIESFFSTSYSLAISSDPTQYSDFTLEASFSPHGGAWDSSGGLVVRYVGPEDYYVLAAECPKGFFGFYRMRAGSPQLIKGVDANFARTQWYQLEVKARGDHFECYLDGKLMFEADDGGISRGRIGLWARQDSRARFDNVKLSASGGDGV